MGIFSRKSGTDEATEQRVFERRSRIVAVLQAADEGDEFTVQTTDGLVADLTVERVEDGLLYGRCDVRGPRIVRVSSGTVHTPEAEGPSSVGFGIDRLEVIEMAACPVFDD